MGAVWAVIKFLNNLWEAFKMITGALLSKRVAERSEKTEKLEAAVDAAKAAKTPEEAYAAQEDIVNNEP